MPGAALLLGLRCSRATTTCGVQHHGQASCTKKLMVEHDSQVISEISCLPPASWSENHHNCSRRVPSAEN